MQDFDRAFRPAILRLAARSLPGTDHLCEKLEVFTTAIEELVRIVGGVHYTGGDEGAFLYWRFELSEDRTEEEAIAAMREAFDGLELQDMLLLYHEYKRKLANIEEGGLPIVRLVKPEEDEES
jgi:hypothetical protein